MTLWMVAADCGDYNCGCGHGHVLGIYTEKDMAVAAKNAAEKAEHFHREKVGGVPGRPFPPHQVWDEVWITEGETDGEPTPPYFEGNPPEWGTVLRKPILLPSLRCSLCGNYDHRKPPNIYAGETCLTCSMGRLVEEMEDISQLPEEES